MKICAYEVRQDELSSFRALAEEFGVEIALHTEVPSLETAALADGCEGVTSFSQGSIDAGLLASWARLGVCVLSTRTVGFDHIDVAAAARAGIRVCNSSYTPESVAEATVMLMLMCLRKYNAMLGRSRIDDFSLHGLIGRNLGSLTVGVLGTGRIGRQVIQILSGFGCRIVAYDPYPVEIEGVENVTRDELLERSDLITLHLPLTSVTRHIIDDAAIARMRDGVVIVNCARGPLISTPAMIRGIESGKIAALGLDVFEGEEGIIHVSHRDDVVADRDLAYLRQLKNVVWTPHMAFYTEDAVSQMVRCGVEGLVDMAAGRPCERELRA